ncbi:hypothetical protein LXL04_032643 [Taraxacum kok-saghyz]
MSLMIIKNSISIANRGTTSNSENAQTYLKSVGEQFRGTSKDHASTLILKMLTTKYGGSSGVCELIMMMTNIGNKLKSMDIEINEGFLVHFIMTSILEEERLKVEKPYAAYVSTTTTFDKKKCKSVHKSSTGVRKFDNKHRCKFCHKKGHTHPTGRNNDTFMIYESLNINIPFNYGWIDSGSMVHVSNSLHEFHTIQKLERSQRTIKVENRKDLNVEVVGSLSLLLESGFGLILNNTIYSWFPNFAMVVLTETSIGCVWTTNLWHLQYLKENEKVYERCSKRKREFNIST